jgi:hypothetical protein
MKGLVKLFFLVVLLPFSDNLFISKFENNIKINILFNKNQLLCQFFRGLCDFAIKYYILCPIDYFKAHIVQFLRSDSSDSVNYRKI